MDDVTAQNYGLMLRNNSQNLEILSSTLPIFHNLMDTLVRQKIKPDIFYLHMRSMKFDNQNIQEIENEILNGLFTLRKDLFLKDIRIAVQVTPNVSKVFINRLIQLGVWDIFKPTGAIDLASVARQLSLPADIGNVQTYLQSDMNNTQVSEQPVIQNAVPKPTNIYKQPTIRKSNHNTSYRPQVKEIANIQNRPRTPANKGSTKRRSDPFQRHKTGLGAIFKAILAMLLLMSCIGGFFFLYSNKVSIPSQKKQMPSFETLIKEKEYVKAAKYYNSKGVEAENKMLEDTSIKYKGDITKQILKYNSSDAIKFDNYYFKQDYESATDIYSTSSEEDMIDLSKARRIMVAYSLMKSGQAAKALKVAEPLDNEDFMERIKIYKKFYDANTILKDKINSGELSGLDLEKAREQVKQNNSEMDKL